MAHSMQFVIKTSNAHAIFSDIGSFGDIGTGKILAKNRQITYISAILGLSL
jgi:hypothetical protein